MVLSVVIFDIHGVMNNSTCFFLHGINYDSTDNYRLTTEATPRLEEPPVVIQKF